MDPQVEHAPLNPMIGQVLTSVSYSCLVLQIYNWLQNVYFEFTCIWMKSSHMPKWQYLFSQYAGIGAQIANSFAITRLFAPEPLSNKAQCQVWYGFVIGMAELLLVSLEITIIHRIYALFHQNKTVVIILSLLVLLEIMTAIIFPIQSVTNAERFGAACMLNETFVPLHCMIYPMVQVFNQIVFFSLTVSKRGIKGIPILSLLVKDGALLFVTLFALLAGVSVHIALSSLKHVTPHMFHILFPIYVGVISIFTCHLIRNVEGVRRKNASVFESSDSESTIVLSSFVTESTHPIL